MAFFGQKFQISAYRDNKFKGTRTEQERLLGKHLTSNKKKLISSLIE